MNIPDCLNPGQYPEIWAATDEARSKCFMSPTSWFRRGDCDMLQYSDSVRWRKEGTDPQDAETILRLMEERIAYEKSEIFPKVEKLCKEWGVVLLTPEQVSCEEHCINHGYLVNEEVEPGYARIAIVNGEYTIEGAVWEKPIQCMVVKDAVRTDNGPAVSHGGIRFLLPNGETKYFGWVSGGFRCLEWGYKIIDGEEPSSPDPKLPFRNVSFHNAPQPGSGHSSAVSQTASVMVSFRKTMYRKNLAGVVKYYICDRETGGHISRPFLKREEADQELERWGAEASRCCVSTGFPWQVNPKTWEPFSSVKTLEELRDAVLAFPGDWERVQRAFPYHSLGSKFAVVTGIDYKNSPAEGGIIVKNPRSERGGTASFFIWDHTTGLDVELITKNGLKWKVPRSAI